MSSNEHTKTYLLTEFGNAKLPRKERGKSTSKLPYDNSKDKIIDPVEGKISRTENRWQTKMFSSPITAYQIANFIRCLKGKNPIPTRKNTLHSHKKHDEDFEKAKDCYLRFTNNTAVWRDGKYVENHFENIQGRSSPYDSWKDPIEVSWVILRSVLRQAKSVKESSDKDAVYNEFLKILEDVERIDTINRSFLEVSNILLYRYSDQYLDTIKPRIDLPEIFRLLRDEKCLSVIDYIFKGENMLKGKYPVQLETRLLNVAVLDGEILVPVNEVDLRMIEESSSPLTMLDGGWVRLRGFVKSNEITESDRFVKVGDIPIDEY